MKKWISGLVICGVVMLLMGACNRPSRVEQYRAEKHRMDSVRLEEQVRSMAYYTAQLDSLMPVADSLIALFTYERNEKYQDHGFYVIKNEKLKIKNYEMRVMVRDDGKEVLAYKNGKRLTDERVNELRREGNEAYQRAEHLQVVIRDIKELEKRIFKTSLEISKYEKRLKANS